MSLLQALEQYKIIAPFLFILLRSSAIIIPPIPGIVFDLVGIMVFGPLWGFVLAEMGVVLGAAVAFWIARCFRESAVKRLASLQKVSKWGDAISERKKFWALVALRVPTNALFDYISYAAGLTKISFKIFFFSSLLGNIPSMAFIYYFGGLSFQKGIYYSIVFLAVLFFLWFLFNKKFTPQHTRTLRP